MNKDSSIYSFFFKKIYSFLSWIPLISFSSLVALARTSSMMLKRSDERGHPCLFPNLSGKASNFSPLKMMLAVVFLQIFFIKLRKISSTPSLLRVFIMNGCWILSNVFSTIYWYNHVIFLFYPVDVMDYINWFLNVKSAFHTRYKSHLFVVYNYFYALLGLIC